MIAPTFRRLFFFFACGLAALAQGTPGSPAPATGNPLVMSIDTWTAAPPFSFVYNGKPSAQLVAGWQRSEEQTPIDGGELHRITWRDPATQLKVMAEVRTFTAFPALDWVVTFSNGGAADTPVIEQIEAMDWKRSCPAHDPEYQEWYGNNGGAQDSESSQDTGLDPAKAAKILNYGGRSARSRLPYFNFFDASYNGSGMTIGSGVIVAVGWTGTWLATLRQDVNAKTVQFVVGMPKTHLVLHPGESIRTPRMVTLSWNGDRLDAQNQWRRLTLAFYTPRPQSGGDLTLPVTFPSGGGTSDARVAQIKSLTDSKIAFDLYGLAGWAKQRGTWTPDPVNFPKGLKPLTDAVKSANMRLMLNMEPEVSDSGSQLLTDHPEWFFPPQTDQPALLDFGNPAALREITMLVSRLIADTGAAFFHHEITFDHLDAVWAAADKPDRVGMTEINYVTGLFSFWDELQRQHPGLLIDQPGSRADIETARRGTVLWRSAYGQPTCNQLQLPGLVSWAPLSAGLFNIIPQGTPPASAAETYTMRSSYGPAWTVNVPLPMNNSFAQALAEYRRMRPFFLGDFYMRSTVDLEPENGMAWQCHRPDLKAGIVMAFRRENCPFSGVQPMLSALDPAASYDVEIKTSLAPGTVQQMSGVDLARIQIPLSEKPSSAIVFYKQR